VWAGGAINPQTLNSYSQVRVLGTGSFGKVLLVKETTQEQQVAALKIIAKERIIKTKQVRRAWGEAAAPRHAPMRLPTLADFCAVGCACHFAVGCSAGLCLDVLDVPV